MLNPVPVVGIAASILILGESAAPIYFVCDAITICAARCTHLRERRAEPVHDQPAFAYNVESANPSASSTRPIRISAVRSICVPRTLATMSASVPVTRSSSGQLAR